MEALGVDDPQDELERIGQEAEARASAVAEQPNGEREYE